MPAAQRAQAPPPRAASSPLTRDGGAAEPAAALPPLRRALLDVQHGVEVDVGVSQLQRRVWLALQEHHGLACSWRGACNDESGQAGL
jgi:hypothetical protein